MGHDARARRSRRGTGLVPAVEPRLASRLPRQSAQARPRSSSAAHRINGGMEHDDSSRGRIAHAGRDRSRPARRASGCLRRRGGGAALREHTARLTRRRGRPHIPDYSVYGLTLASNLGLFGLPAAPALVAPDISLTLDAAPAWRRRSLAGAAIRYRTPSSE